MMNEKKFFVRRKITTHTQKIAMIFSHRGAGFNFKGSCRREVEIFNGT